MKKNVLLTLVILCSLFKLSAQEIKSTLYEGKMNDDMSVSFYLRAQENECNADTEYTGMYKYNGVSNWLQLDITENDEKHYACVEYRFTGVLILQKTSEGFAGIWISPDAKRQLKVTLKKVELLEEDIEAFEDAYEEVNYGNNDC